MRVRLHIESRDPSVRGVPVPRHVARRSEADGGTDPPVVALPVALGDGLCADSAYPDMWHDWTLREDAARVCRACPVMVECGEWATVTGARGTWGGEWRGRPQT
jgi:hypothetical protein